MNKIHWNGLLFEYHAKNEVIKIYLNWIEKLLLIN